MKGSLCKTILEIREENTLASWQHRNRGFKLP